MSAWITLLLLAQDAEPLDVYGKVLPVLAVHCHKCHGPDLAKGKLRLDSRAAVLPALNELVRRVALPADDEERMPPEGPRLAKKEVDALRRWAAAGAPWPERDDYWAFQPPKESSGTIDGFIDARLAAAGIRPVEPADPRTLIRRLSFDLIGLPPTPEEVDDFLRDPNLERAIDRLLADPRYGEHWARKWLDLARYAESNGYEDDKIRPHAWRYRDYVIRSFNADKPYDRFVREQIAGDELYPDDPDAWIATGFARLGPWDGMSMDPAQRRQDFLNDATDALGSVFFGMTVGCARCHDHKYDRVTQLDYYGLQAFFAGAKRESRELPGEDPAEIRERWRVGKDALDAAKRELDGLRQAAREEIAFARRCEGDVKIEDGELNKRIDGAARGRLEARIKEQGAIEILHRRAAEACFGSAPGKTWLLKRGELGAKGPEVPPRFVEAMVPPGRAVARDRRRAELARWMSSPEHPLVARVIVNRLWQEHFGRGLVATPSDFGRNGDPPSHPELLDWLARRLVRDGWSLKSMHRLLLSSAAWRRASRHEPNADPENRLWWRMNRRRLDAEAIRDSILYVAGRLNPAGGGPGVYAPLPAGINVELPNNDKELSWYAAPEPDGRRRTVYVAQRRSLTFPIVEVFDGPSMNQSCPKRSETTVAPQALALFNGEFSRSEAKAFAERAKDVDRAFRLAFGRRPSEVERARAEAFLKTGSLSDLCHVLLNANEFIYVD